MKNYLRRICLIIFLTSIPSILSLPVHFNNAIAWILGALASTINFLWMARIASESMNHIASGSKMRTIKGFYLRYVFLLLYALLVMLFLKPEILVFGFALLSAQFAIYIELLYSKFSHLREKSEHIETENNEIRR